MDINELRKERTKTEGELAIKIAEIIERFRQRTGVSIENVYIDMVETTERGDGQREYITGIVSCIIAF